MITLSTKHKLGLSLLVLASANGATFSLVNPSSLFSSLPSFGGGVGNQVVNLGNYSSEAGKFSLENSQVSNFKIGALDKGFSTQINLEMPMESKLTEFKETAIEATSLTDTVQNVHSEINKEKEVMKVEKESTEAYKKEETILQRQSHSFSSGLDKLADYGLESASPTSPPGRSRRKRAAVPVSSASSTPLSKEERKALQTYFESFKKLSKESKQLLNKLSEANRSSFMAQFGNSEYEVKDIISALKKINWTGDQLTLTQTIIKPGATSWWGRSAVEHPNEGNFYGWGSWEASPWRYFFKSEQDWKQKWGELIKTQRALKSFLDRRAPWCLLAIIGTSAAVKACFREKEEYEKKISQFQGDVERHIGAWLIYQMRLRSS